MFGVKKTGLIAKISIKYVLPTSIWKYFWRNFAVFRIFGGISRKYLNFAGPRPRKISEALPLGPNRLSQRDFAHIYFVNMFCMSWVGLKWTSRSLGLFLLPSTWSKSLPKINSDVIWFRILLSRIKDSWICRKFVVFTTLVEDWWHLFAHCFFDNIHVTECW